MKPVISAGEILIDLIAPPGESLGSADQFAIREGGAPMNAAIAMARLGVPVRFCGVVGNDQFGERLRALLFREGVDTSALRTTDEAPTSIAYAWRDMRGDGHFQLLRLADRLISIEDVTTIRLDDAGALLVGSVALAASPSREAITDLVQRASHLDLPLVFDVNVRPTLWESREALRGACQPILNVANLIKVSLDDASHLWDTTDPLRVLESLRPFAPQLVVMTDGSRGVFVADQSLRTVKQYDVFPVEAVDPTGAGDAFTAALVSRLMRRGWTHPVDDDIRFAMGAGALATTRQGALTALPTMDVLQAFLAERK